MIEWFTANTSVPNWAIVFGVILYGMTFVFDRWSRLRLEEAIDAWHDVEKAYLEMNLILDREEAKE